MIPPGLVPMGTALFCGALLGSEREVRGSAAGLRTTMLITVGSALVACVGHLVAGDPRWTADVARVDPTRMASYVVAGIGFLGAGSIIRSGGRLHGLTSAATVWLAAAVGVCLGLEYYALGVGTTLAVLVVLHLLRPLRDRLAGPGEETTVALVAPEDPFRRQRLLHLLGEYRARHEATTDGATGRERWTVRYQLQHREASRFLERLDGLLDRSTGEAPPEPGGEEAARPEPP